MPEIAIESQIPFVKKSLSLLMAGNTFFRHSERPAGFATNFHQERLVSDNKSLLKAPKFSHIFLGVYPNVLYQN